MSNSARAALPLAPGLYPLVDTDALGARDPLDFTRRLLAAGGFSLLQLRAKNKRSGELLLLARRMAEMCFEAGVALWLNDRPDLGLMAGALGVHVGIEDLSVADVRSVAPGCWVGASSHDDREVSCVLATDADYIAFGPVFGTTSKANAAPAVGAIGLARVVQRLRDAGDGRPVVAIGGVSTANAARVREAGARCGAVISGLMVRDQEVTGRARELHRLLGGQ